MTCRQLVEVLPRPEINRFVEDDVTEVICPVDDAPPLNDCRSENLLLSERSVVEATVMLAVPSNETPLMVRAVCSAVAVPALPEIEPVMSEVKVFAPENLLASARSVVEATVMEPPRDTDAPLMVMAELARSVFCTVAQVATPDPLRERENWLVQEEPVYAMVPPVELARWRAEVIEVMARLVVVAFASVVLPVTLSVPATAVLPAESMVVEAVAPKDSVFPVARVVKRLVVVPLVAVKPPLNAMLVVVALSWCFSFLKR